MIYVCVCVCVCVCSSPVLVSSPLVKLSAGCSLLVKLSAVCSLLISGRTSTGLDCCMHIYIYICSSPLVKLSAVCSLLISGRTSTGLDCCMHIYIYIYMQQSSGEAFCRVIYCNCVTQSKKTIRSNLLLWAHSGCPLFRSSYTCFPNSNDEKLNSTQRPEIAVGIRTGEKKVLRIHEVLKQRESELDELEYYKERRRLKGPGLVGEQGEIIFWEYNVKILRPLLSGCPSWGSL
ncbi:hypothetical protein POTOM_036422 [Populus tomentosa]|uniref:Uncharacterized protein n=1 Tax=Populus tomentosa TaxID=118781 RepID=A0A8X7YZM5_POPTO|nr:hypothetical protein POTOM_036422 [Populus tomentosa]